MMNIIIVTVGVSIIDKTWNRTRTYEQLLGSDNRNRGLLSDCNIEEIERGVGWLARHTTDNRTQQEIENECFQKSTRLLDISHAIKLGKDNRYSAEVSSLYAILKGENIDLKDCHIVLLATDSQEGVLAARLNKRVIAHRILGCDKDVVLRWNSESDNHLHQAFSQIPIRRVKDLQVTDAAKFERSGHKSLAQIIKDIDECYVEADKRILNMTGGFKGVIPIAVAHAWRYGWVVAYLYEETEKCLIIPRPGFVKIDPAGGDMDVQLPSLEPE